METFIQRSSDLLSIVNKLKKNSTDINYDDDFEALANDFIQSRMKDLLDWYVRILEHCNAMLWAPVDYWDGQDIASFWIFRDLLSFIVNIIKLYKLHSQFYIGVPNWSYIFAFGFRQRGNSTYSGYIGHITYINH